jgi:hypothetical protein
MLHFSTFDTTTHNFDSFFSACNHLHSVSIYYDVLQSRRQEFLENNTISLLGRFHLWNVEVYEKNICLPIRSKLCKTLNLTSVCIAADNSEHVQVLEGE